jgi:hypothetical protein
MLSLLKKKKGCDSMSNKKRKRGTPFIGEHTAFVSFFLPAGTEKTVFEDVTTNHNKAMVRLAVGVAPVTFIVRTRDGKKIERTIVRNSNSLIIQVENIKSISARCDAATGTCNGAINIEKTFCIFC